MSNGYFQQLLSLLVNLAVFADIFGHIGVAERMFAVSKTLLLYLLRSLHPGADRLGFFPAAFLRQIPVLHRGNFKLDVNAVQQRPANAGKIALDLQGRAGAFLVGIGIVAAGATVKCCKKRFCFRECATCAAPSRLRRKSSIKIESSPAFIYTIQ